MIRRTIGRLTARFDRATTRLTDMVQNTVADVMRPFIWRPITTAPFNRNVALRVAEAGRVHTLPFPCRRTNSGHWLNADLGTAIAVNPTQWCIWRRSDPFCATAACDLKAHRHRQLTPAGAMSSSSSLRLRPIQA